MSNFKKEFDEAREELKNAIYKTAVDIFETYERTGKISGSGHHAAQKVAEDAGIELLIRWHRDNKDISNDEKYYVSDEAKAIMNERRKDNERRKKKEAG